jgi:hypothetical protein
MIDMISLSLPGVAVIDLQCLGIILDGQIDFANAKDDNIAITCRSSSPG